MQDSDDSLHQRHLAMIESYDDEYFYVRDSRDNINGDYYFRVKKDKLMFLTGNVERFFLSKL